nr:ABC transporter permease [Pseudothauera hydrothermalis]
MSFKRGIGLLLAPWRPVARGWDLFRVLLVRDVSLRFKGASLGFAWSVITPLVMLAVYYFTFGIVLNLRWGVAEGSNSQFVAVLYSGLIVYGLLAEVLSRSTELVVGNSNYVKKVVFPLEILSWASVGSALFNFFVGLLLLSAYAFYAGMPNVAALWLLPTVLLPYVFILVAVSLVLSSLTCYIRDVRQIVGPLTTGLMFLSPVFYPLESVPAQFRVIVAILPAALPIEVIRGVLLGGELPEFAVLARYWIAALATLYFAQCWFSRLKTRMADVL